MPTLRPFRALRYDIAAVGDLSAVICPPYDVIAPAERERLLARHPCNAVRVEFPVPPGEEDGGYRRAAETLQAWQAEGVLRTEPAVAVYVYEQRYRLDGADERTQRGVFVRLLIEPWGDGVRPHERTLSGPKQDRLRLLRATATDTSPIVVLAAAAGRLADVLDGVARGPADAEATDDSGTRHRLWVVPEGQVSESILRAAGDGALTIADGHHRYETALRYRDERREETHAGARIAGDRPEDYVLALLIDAGATQTGPTILPTHRLVHGEPAVADELIEHIRASFAVSLREAGSLVDAFMPPFAASPGRMAAITPGAAVEITLDPARARPLFEEGTADVVRSLDVAVLEAMLRPYLEWHPAVTLTYTHDAREAAQAVASGDAVAAFLLAPTPLESVIAVAAAGAVMPQKSTYFHPKAATGLVMYPLG